MKTQHLSRIELSNSNLPGEIRELCDYIQDRIYNFEELYFILAKLSVSQESTILKSKITRMIKDARFGIELMNEYSAESDNEKLKTVYLQELKEHADNLLSDPLDALYQSIKIKVLNRLGGSGSTVIYG